MKLPDWVLLLYSTPTSLADQDEPTTRARCARCGREVTFTGPRQEDERALGRFAQWHRRCRDPELVRAAVAAALARREEAAQSGARIVWRRKH